MLRISFLIICLFFALACHRSKAGNRSSNEPHSNTGKIIAKTNKAAKSVEKHDQAIQDQARGLFED